MSDPATTLHADPSGEPAPPVPALVLLAADDALVCVDDLCVSPDDEAALDAGSASTEATR